MQKFYYAAGAMVLVLGGLGIYSSQAGNKMMQNQGSEYMVEEVVYRISPKDKPMEQKRANPMSDSAVNDMNKPNHKGGFMPLPEDKGVEVAPIESNMQNPNLEQTPPAEMIIEDNVTETIN
ncbi:MAG: hypothetical protein E7016_07370 [Alphaproteobacteria bacterium]|nr:hypothetical protein [Alphaproteobacteria bacterium]